MQKVASILVLLPDANLTTCIIVVPLPDQHTRSRGARSVFASNTVILFQLCRLLYVNSHVVCKNIPTVYSLMHVAFITTKCFDVLSYIHAWYG